MNKIYTYILSLILVGAVYGCDNADVDAPGVKQEGYPILLSSANSASTAEAGTRATTNFPNNGSIGIVAATKLYDVPEMTDWSLYADISNRHAVATSVDNNGVYSFQWDSPCYWPFDGSDLYFMAYSPISDGTDNGYIIDDMKRSIFMNLKTQMPDVMYASNNTAYIPHNKTTGVVNLGEFRHALSQLTINIDAAPGLPSKIKVSNLTVSTPYSTANLYLPLGEFGLIPVPGVTFFNELLNVDTSLASTISRELLLFPGTEDATQISVTLHDTDSGYRFTGNYMISFFQSDAPGQPILLEQGKNTVLRITVNLIDLEKPSEKIDLKGRITDWSYKGHFNIGIN